MAVLIGVAAGMAFAAFVTAFLAWVSMGNQIRTLSERVKDYLLIKPTPGVQGAITARLFEAMKDVCESAKAHDDTLSRWAEGKKNPSTLVSDANALYDEYAKAGEEFKAALARLRKIEGSHRIDQR